jgi:hypothetical protein
MRQPLFYFYFTSGVKLYEQVLWIIYIIYVSTLYNSSAC